MSVSIIGAGLAGSVLANKLVSAGLDKVVVIEKSRGRGGRMATKRLQWGHMDMGAQYFTARSQAFTQSVALWQTNKWVEPWNFVPHAERDGKLVLSPDEQTRFVASPDMNSLCKQLINGIDIQLNTRVKSLQRSNGFWHLYDANQELITRTKLLVLTCPLEQSRQLLMEFPSVLDRLPKAAHLPCWSVGLATNGHVDESLQGVFAEGDISWISRQNKKPQRAVSEQSDLWSIQYSAPWSIDHQDLAAPLIVEDAFKQLRTRLLNSALCDSDLSFVEGYAHFWRYARPNPELSIEKGVVEEPSIGLIVAGDWCFGGRVEGAYLSANESAQLILSK